MAHRATRAWMLAGMLLATLTPLAMAGPAVAAPAVAGPTAARDVVRAADGVRECRYVPGVSVLAEMPPEVIDAPVPSPTLLHRPPWPRSFSRETSERQLGLLQELWDAVNDHYVYPDFLGHDWAAIGNRYRALIRRGLPNDAFHAALGAMVGQLGDEHSQVLSPEEVRVEADLVAGRNDFVGIGAMLLPITGSDTAAVMTVFPNSPAADAGLQSHDVLRAVDDGPIRDATGTPRTLGLPGTPVTLTIGRPGEPSREVTVTRRRVTGILPIDACLVPGTRVGYIFLPTFMDETVGDQVRDVIARLTADGPLDGLVLDLRVNGGGLGSAAESVMRLFASGSPGDWVSREGSTELQLRPEDVGGSQTVPMVVLVGQDTVSYGEIVAGVLRVAGRATIMGQPTLGNVEQLRAYDLTDGSRAWIASATFQPRGAADGIWERTGIIPDVMVPTRWDLFTEASDPALARAVDLLDVPGAAPRRP